MHIMSTEEKSWVQSRIEPVMASPEFNAEKKSKNASTINLKLSVSKNYFTRFVRKSEWQIIVVIVVHCLRCNVRRGRAFRT